MTDFKLLQQALDALEFPHDSEWSNKAKAIEALQNALTQPEFDTPESHIVKWSIPVDPNNFGEPLAQPEQEPDCGEAGHDEGRCGNFHCITKPAPPKPEQEDLIQFMDGKWSYVRKPWVGLTSEELATIVVEHAGFPTKQAQAISDKLKEKNT